MLSQGGSAPPCATPAPRTSPDDGSGKALLPVARIRADMQRALFVFGGILMAIVLVASLVRAGQKLASGALTAAAAPSTGGIAATMSTDGVQRVTLGFGQFNYAPDTIRVKRDIPVVLTADQSVRGCFSTFTIPELRIWKRFTETDRTLTFTPKRAGTFRFSCAMGMGSGRLIVES